MQIDLSSIKYMEPNIPCYCFDQHAFVENVFFLKDLLGRDIDLVYSVKANPFMIKTAAENTDGIEICSLGELFFAKQNAIDSSKITFGGICKQDDDFKAVIEYGVKRFSIESVSQLSSLNRIAHDAGVTVDVLIRVSAGNQFGMSVDDAKCCLQTCYANIKILGYHYYPGTMRQSTQNVEKDFDKFSNCLKQLEQFNIFEIEYGGGIGVNYYGESEHWELAKTVATKLQSLAGRVKITYEAGRLVTYNTGVYITRVVDIKNVDSRHFVVVNGGRHQFTYHGGIFKLGRKKPCVTVVRNSSSDKIEKYTIVGSLCNEGDVFANDVELPGLNIGDYIMFNNAGSYSITEGTALFLSRDLPAVYYQQKGKLLQVRARSQTDWLKTIYEEKVL